MKKLPVENNFTRVVLNGIPLMDVRAPVEFKAGAFPKAVNLPILDDQDRHLVGICYKHQGRQAAFDLAESRVSGRVREERIAAWQQFVRTNPDTVFYCFRGGMRSTTAQEWLHGQTGTTVRRLEGGYKAFRRFLIEALLPSTIRATPLILGGRTGAGKTLLLRQLDNSIDLEKIANHRGSAFGGFLTPQPGQIDFENTLAYAVICHNHNNFRYMVLEDEGSYIGARYIPHELAAFFRRDSMVLLESSMEERIDRTAREYVVDAQNHYQNIFGDEQGLQLWLEYMQSRMERIGKRLGRQRLQRVLHYLQSAWAEQTAGKDRSGHNLWIELLLREYYDPMYDYQIGKSGRRIAFRGQYGEVLDYLRILEKTGQASHLQ